jgi:CYTH domain-containing protein
MRYIVDTSTLNVQIYASQRDHLDRIKREIEDEYNVKIPLSELVRRALEYGIPVVDADHSFAIELIG